MVGLAVHGLVNIGGDGIHTLLDAWVSCAAEGLAAVLCAFAAIRSERNRVAWLLIAAAMGLWAVGDVIWAIRGDPEATATISDVFWLAWYPLLVAALVLLVRDRVPRFELHRWIDGVIVMLVVVTPWVALFLEPAANHSNESSVVQTVDFAYPLGDAIIVGAMLGVLALMGWRAGPMWLALVMGFAALGHRRRGLLGRRARPQLQLRHDLRRALARRARRDRVRRVAPASRVVSIRSRCTAGGRSRCRSPRSASRSHSRSTDSSPMCRSPNASSRLRCSSSRSSRSS